MAGFPGLGFGGFSASRFLSRSFRAQPVDSVYLGKTGNRMVLLVMMAMVVIQMKLTMANNRAMMTVHVKTGLKLALNNDDVSEDVKTQ